MQKKITYITENLIGLSGTNGILLIRVASPLVQVGAVEDIAQHVLAPLGYLVSNNIRREVDLGLGLMVVLLVDPLSGQNIMVKKTNKKILIAANMKLKENVRATT